MARRKRRAAKKRKVEWSKVVCLLAMLAGLLIVQECLFLMYLCIKSGYTAAAAWLTAATGVGEAIIIAEGIHMLNPLLFDPMRSRATEVRPQARRDHL